MIDLSLVIKAKVMGVITNTDFSTCGHKVMFEMNGVKTYVHINMGFYFQDDVLEHSDVYFIYLLHPKHGSLNFAMSKLTGKWAYDKKQVLLSYIEEYANKLGICFDDARLLLTAPSYTELAVSNLIEWLGEEIDKYEDELYTKFSSWNK